MRIWLLLVFLLLFFCGLLFSQSPMPGSTASISGRVVNSANNEPVRKATVNLTLVARDETDKSIRQHYKTSTLLASTNENGAFEFHGLADGEYFISCEHFGFVPPIYRKTERFRLKAGSNLQGLELRLAPAAIITGRVTDRDGDAIEGVRVTATQRSQLSKTATFPPIAERTATDDEGRYRILVPEGEYAVFAQNDRAFRLRAANSELAVIPAPVRVFRQTYFPGSTSLSSSSTVRVDSGREARADIVVQQEPSVSLRGQVVGIPAPGLDDRHYVVLELIDPESNEVVALTAFREGDAQFILEAAPPGEFEAVAKMQFYDDRFFKRFSVSQRLRIEKGAPLNVILTLQPQMPKTDCAPYPSGMIGKPCN
jgi:hypothetical protein